VAKSLRELRPCDNCNGPVGLLFYVVRFSLAVVDHQAINETLGMRQFFGGNASAALIENFTPSARDAIKVAMDNEQTKELMTELFICRTCYMQPIDLAMLTESVNERRKKTEHNDADAVR
jgi:hypothetical protein